MQLIVCDFDGTYYTNEESILINNKYINEFRNKGNLFMLSSGRSFKSLKEMTIKYNIPYDYLSCCDGSILYDNKNNIIIKYPLNNTILKKFLNLKKFVKAERIQYSYPDDYYNKICEGDLIGCNLVIKNEFINNKFLKEFNKLKEIYKEFDFLIYSHDEITFFCLKNSDINKSSTVKYLEKELNLNYNNILIFGDNENDYPMLSLYNSYFIGNVDSKIKEVCLKGFNNVYEFFK